ncbi:MAG: hypothetical protein OD816_000284 [Thermodesulfobacterium sp.]|uniref:Uncharacterized protein n=1 Tax=Candidatus Thermodesulfobacterium syntrophicum TaxID=3060442 RepID=A0AAE3TFK2_9BACT|nr:hypothetical protein [Candidatus Thermodesulfobacterium syntrophicum]
MFGYIDSISIETQACLSCHRIVTPGIVKNLKKGVADPSNPFLMKL